MFFKTDKEKLKEAGFVQTDKYTYKKTNETTYVLIKIPNEESNTSDYYTVKPETKSLKDINDIDNFYYLSGALKYAETLLHNKTIEYKRQAETFNRYWHQG